jgi:hypothetical protein
MQCVFEVDSKDMRGDPRTFTSDAVPRSRKSLEGRLAQARKDPGGRVAKAKPITTSTKEGESVLRTVRKACSQ